MAWLCIRSLQESRMNEGHLRGRKDKALMQGMLQWAKMLQKVYVVCLCPGKKRADGNTNRSVAEWRQTSLTAREGGTLWGL